MQLSPKWVYEFLKLHLLSGTAFMLKPVPIRMSNVANYITVHDQIQ